MMTGSLIEQSTLPAIRRGWSFIINKLRVGPLSPEQLAIIGGTASTVHLKTMQHSLSVGFPNYKISGDFLRDQYHFSKIKIKVNGDYLDWNDTISAYYASNVFIKSDVFKDTVFTIKQAPVVSPGISKICQKAYIQTKQPFPDYYVYLKTDNGKDLVWDRFFDLKSGNFSPFKGHLILGTTDEQMAKLSEDLLNRQLAFIRTTKQHLDLERYLRFLVDRTDIGWIQKNIELQRYYSSVLKEKPNFSPSMVFQIQNPDYDLNHTSPDASFNTQSFITATETRKSIVNTLLHAGYVVTQNYIKTSSGCSIIKKTLEEIHSAATLD